MKFREFMVTYSVVATAVGMIVGTAITNIFKAWSRDVLMPIFIDSWYPKNKETIRILGFNIKFKDLLGHVINLGTTLVSLWFIVRYLSQYTKYIPNNDFDL